MALTKAVETPSIFVRRQLGESGGQEAIADRPLPELVPN